MEQTKSIKTREKQEVAGPAEQTRPGPVFAPAVDIFENDELITVLADMPGVKNEELHIDLRENVLTLTGGVTPLDKEEERPVLREYRSGTFFRQFTLSETIDQERIEATLRDGVLRLELPKVQAAVPRQIPVKTR
jgi:HSP20 family molecular chaperone IbpA